MKKLLWILGTIFAWLFYTFFAGAFMMVWNIAKSIVTRSEIQSLNQTVFNIVVYLGAFVFVVLSMWLWKRWNAKCHACKRWAALERVQIDAIKQENISVKMQLSNRNSRGDVTGTQEQYVPGKRITYQDTYKCKYCGNLKVCKRTESGANL